MPGKFNLDDYVTVNTRIERFYTKYPEGAIRTVLLSDPGAKTVVLRAEVYRDYHDIENPISVGHAHEIEGVGMVNQTSAMENCETSAVGRALAMAGFEVTKGVASREEMAGAARRQEYLETNAAKPQTSQNFSPKSGNADAPKPQGSDMVLGFGKNRGKHLSEIDNGYLAWLDTHLPEQFGDPQYGSRNKELHIAVQLEIDQRKIDQAAEVFGAEPVDESGEQA